MEQMKLKLDDMSNDLTRKQCELKNEFGIKPNKTININNNNISNKQEQNSRKENNCLCTNVVNEINEDSNNDNNISDDGIRGTNVIDILSDNEIKNEKENVSEFQSILDEIKLQMSSLNQKLCNV